MSDKNTSTLQSYIDSASGAVQSAIGSLSGNASNQVCCPPTFIYIYKPYFSSTSPHTSPKSSSPSFPSPLFPIPKHLTNPSLTTQIQNAGEAKKSKAELEKEASHATAKLGPYSASSSGAVTKDDPNRTEGSWNQTVGSAKSAVGGLVGVEVRPNTPCLHHLLQTLPPPQKTTYSNQRNPEQMLTSFAVNRD